MFLSGTVSDTARYWWKIADLYLPPPLFEAPVWGNPIGILLRSLASANQSPWAITWRCLRDPRFNHIRRTSTCDRWMDRQTDT